MVTTGDCALEISPYGNPKKPHDKCQKRSTSAEGGGGSFSAGNIHYEKRCEPQKKTLKELVQASAAKYLNCCCNRW